MLSKNKRTKEIKLMVQNKNENKMNRVRPGDHAKADGSLLIISKQTNFAVKAT